MHQVRCLQSGEGLLLTTHQTVSLTLAMLTIGALYASEPDRAAALYSIASECVEQVSNLYIPWSAWRYLQDVGRKAVGAT
jgi:hypothetical protein